MHMAGLRVRPGIENRDHRPVLPLLRRIAHLHRARAMAEGAEIVGREPARAAERFRSFLSCHESTCVSSLKVISQAVGAGQAPLSAGLTPDASADLVAGRAFSRNRKSCR